MSDWRDVAWFTLLWAMLVLAMVWLTGCTATTLEQQTAAAKAIEGHYVDGIGCTRLRVADGRAAVAAAQENKARQVQVQQRAK